MNPIAKLITVLLVGATMLASTASQALTPTREQVQKAWEKRFQDMDQNQDGKVSLEEYLAFHGAESPLIPSCSLTTINDPIEACGGGDQFSVVFQGD